MGQRVRAALTNAFANLAKLVDHAAGDEALDERGVQELVLAA